MLQSLKEIKHLLKTYESSLADTAANTISESSNGQPLFL